jgi:menaquinone-dependent protoporphyrinogen oxidase
MNVLVIYETVEGQTRKVVESVEEETRAAGHNVRVLDTSDHNAKVDFAEIDRVVLAAPVHERRHPKDFELFLAANREALAALATLMISVSLKASYTEGLEDAEDYLLEMKMRTGLIPSKELLIAGAVRSQSYGYFETQIVHKIVLEGRPVELVDGVREFTDWDRLKSEVNAFLRSPHLV